MRFQTRNQLRSATDLSRAKLKREHARPFSLTKYFKYRCWLISLAAWRDIAAFQIGRHTRSMDNRPEFASLILFAKAYCAKVN